MRIRPETPRDHEAVGRVHHRAFRRWNEAHLVESIRATRGYVPELSLVAEDEGEVVAHAMASHVSLERPGGEDPTVPVAALAPLAVRPSHQGRGVGTALLKAVLEAARSRDEPIVAVVGEPAFYGRLGFVRGDELDLRPSLAIPPQVFLVKTLAAYRPELRGRVVYPPAFASV